MMVDKYEVQKETMSGSRTQPPVGNEKAEAARRCPQGKAGTKETEQVDGWPGKGMARQAGLSITLTEDRRGQRALGTDTGPAKPQSLTGLGQHKPRQQRAKHESLARGLLKLCFI